jgi:hypothetical protein
MIQTENCSDPNPKHTLRHYSLTSLVSELTFDPHCNNYVLMVSVIFTFHRTQTSSQSHATHTVTPTVTPTQPEGTGGRGFSLSSHSHVIVSVAVALICFSRLLHL